jgi:hypothetical protein
MGFETRTRTMLLLLASPALLGILGCERTSAPTEASGPSSLVRWPNEVNLVGAGDIAWQQWR